MSRENFTADEFHKIMTEMSKTIPKTSLGTNHPKSLTEQRNKRFADSNWSTFFENYQTRVTKAQENKRADNGMTQWQNECGELLWELQNAKNKANKENEDKLLGILTEVCNKSGIANIPTTMEDWYKALLATLLDHKKIETLLNEKINPRATATTTAQPRPDTTATGTSTNQHAFFQAQQEPPPKKEKTPFILQDSEGDNFVTRITRDNENRRYEVHGTNSENSGRQPRVIYLYDDGNVKGFNNSHDLGVVGGQMYTNREAIFKHFGVMLPNAHNPHPLQPNQLVVNTTQGDMKVITITSANRETGAYTVEVPGTFGHESAHGRYPSGKRIYDRDESNQNNPDAMYSAVQLTNIPIESIHKTVSENWEQICQHFSSPGNQPPAPSM